MLEFLGYEKNISAQKGTHWKSTRLPYKDVYKERAKRPKETTAQGSRSFESNKKCLKNNNELQAIKIFSLSTGAVDTIRALFLA